MSFAKCLVLVFGLPWCCAGQDDLAPGRLDNQVQASLTLVSSQPVISVIPNSGKRVPRQTENSALENLRSIAAGKGSTLRGRSRGRGRGKGRERQPAGIDYPRQTQSKPTQAATTTRPQKKKVLLTRDKILTDLEPIQALDNNIDIRKEQRDKEDIPTHSRQGEVNIATQRKRPRTFRKENKPFLGQPDTRVGHSKVRSRHREEERHRKKKEKKTVTTVTDVENRAAPGITGCHQICDTLIFEVYKLLQGTHCDC